MSADAARVALIDAAARRRATRAHVVRRQGGSGFRGFAFIECATPAEASLVLERLRRRTDGRPSGFAQGRGRSDHGRRGGVAAAGAQQPAAAWRSHRELCVRERRRRRGIRRRRLRVGGRPRGAARRRRRALARMAAAAVVMAVKPRRWPPRRRRRRASRPRAMAVSPSGMGGRVRASSTVSATTGGAARWHDAFRALMERSSGPARAPRRRRRGVRRARRDADSAAASSSSPACSRWTACSSARDALLKRDLFAEPTSAAARRAGETARDLAAKKNDRV